MIRRLQLWILQWACRYSLADLETGGWLTKEERQMLVGHLTAATNILLKARAIKESAEKLAGPEHPVRRAQPLK